ncbi:GNAT family N-acetyltransferase [Jannaschia aquimarina]|uniref:Acetyltransferase (GNAT) family protein n=1 Tax=Jannaschia aquimarina TaxID=935700 RepID=A0A0D1CQP1_9RHOB|nr:GNAT family N-acetyltransferase [Jannaschia aquimarina]KIT17097.1 Acetyltransferase (GNAT) family protein [Jannaschia aquimarina]SNS46736.1 Acetyltransferase (GNAT) domain-containing protein [Jannaschia aquimarina]
MIQLEPRHRDEIETFLRGRITEAMFPLANLSRYGMEGGHPRAMTFWAGDPAAPDALLGLSDECMAMPVWPDGTDPRPFAQHLTGRDLMGATGATHAVRPVIEACGLIGAPAHLDADEPQFLLSLDRLDVPDGPGRLVPLDADRQAAERWRLAYLRELHLGEGTPEDAAKDIDRWIEADSHRLLIDDGRPLALTGFNAALPDIVQVGGVYVPSEMRGRRLGGRAVALHLAEAREQGVRQATLFAASETAVRCYARLGFERIGTYTLLLFDGKQVAR